MSNAVIYRLDDNPRTYTDSKGAVINDASILDYIKKLTIPPNYHNVQIFYNPQNTPKISYQGYDSKERLQRIYSEKWSSSRKKQKFCELLHFCDQFEKMIKTIDALLVAPLSKEKCIAMILKLIMICYFRIGNRKYKELYGSFGAMTVLKDHVQYKDGGVFISFPGKKGVINTCTIHDKVMISEIKMFMSNGSGRELFTYPKEGNLVPLKAIDINKWLAKFDSLITSKDFRTYNANILLLEELKKYDPSGKVGRKKHLLLALEYAANMLHNTPNILKKEYAELNIIEEFLLRPSSFEEKFPKGEDTRLSFARLLRTICAPDGTQ